MKIPQYIDWVTVYRHTVYKIDWCSVEFVAFIMLRQNGVVEMNIMKYFCRSNKIKHTMTTQIVQIIINRSQRRYVDRRRYGCFINLHECTTYMVNINL